MSTSHKVWSQFSGRSGNIKLRILDAPKDRMGEAIDLYLDHYLAGEALTKASGVPKSDEATAEYRAYTCQEFKSLSEIHVMICTIENDEDKAREIIGVSLSYLSTAEKPFDIKVKPKTKEVQKLIELSDDMMSLYDILSEHKVDKCYDGLGIIVHPSYRGLGIAQEFLKARRLMCKEQGIPVTAAWMTSIGTQKAGERDGYVTVYELNFDEFGKKHGVSFETPKICKLMLAKVL